MQFETLSQWRRAAFCIAIAERNKNHAFLYSEIQEQDPKPYTKLLSKTWAFLLGDLKSIDNLERFFNEFDQWQNNLLENQDSFGAEAAQQACQSLYSASYGLLDETANDCEFVQLSNQQLLNAFIEMGNDGDELSKRQEQYEQELFGLLTSGKPKREVLQLMQQLARSEEESSLGINMS